MSSVPKMFINPVNEQASHFFLQANRYWQYVAGAAEGNVGGGAVTSGCMGIS